MASLTEEAIINKLADHVNAIVGIEKAYGFAQNPDNLSSAQLPAMMFFSNFTSGQRAHHNMWGNSFTVQGILFVVERGARGATLNFLENAAIPFGMKVRQKFQDSTVIQNMLSLGVATTKTFLVSGNYGTHPLLNHGGIEYIGWVFTWEFFEVN